MRQVVKHYEMPARERSREAWCSACRKGQHTKHSQRRINHGGGTVPCACPRCAHKGVTQ